MSTKKGKQEIRTILDFSQGKISKNSVRKALRQVVVEDVLDSETDVKLIYNVIKVGPYKIHLRFPFLSETNKKLKEYGKFKIVVSEMNRDVESAINLSSDRRFKTQYWISHNENFQMLMKTLADVIVYCGRLNRLKSFL